jgi:putative addiction module component (TIGR02574 family)
MNAELASHIDRLTPGEKLQLVEEIWDNLAAGEDPLPLPDWHKQILAEDEAGYRTNPSAGASRSEVKTRITDKPSTARSKH